MKWFKNMDEGTVVHLCIIGFGILFMIVLSIMK